MNAKDQFKIASNIRYLRLEYSYTQSEIACRLHISRSTYSLIESGKRSISTDLVIALADLYHVSVGTILSIDKSRFLKDVKSGISTDVRISRLNQLFFSLSPYSQGCLIERAEALYEEEENKRSKMKECSFNNELLL